MPISSLVAILAGVFGLLIGSFLNVVIWRVPRGESLNFPASHCPHCNHAIRPWDNIPVISWIVLRGKCRDCGARVTPRYLLVELGTGIFFAVVALWVFASPEAPASIGVVLVTLVAYLYLAAISIALAFIDLETHRLPNVLVLPGYIVGLVLLTVTCFLTGDFSPLIVAAIAGAALFALYFVMALVYPGGMGFGDVKLAGVIGIFLGWQGWGEVAVGAFAPFVLGGIFSLVLILSKRAGRKSGIPFGPWMLIGAWVGIFVGRELSGWYLGLFGLV